jgi:uncharacterized protein
MLHRRLHDQITRDLKIHAAVALLGPRQVGKTTLARAIGLVTPSLYLDLEDPADRDKLSEPTQFLEAHTDKLVIIDEIHNAPDLFAVLRGIIDRGRRSGKAKGRFLLLGSASIELMKQSSESLAGRIAYRELSPLDVTEIAAAKSERLWVRGGFPASFLAGNEAESRDWRRDFLRTYLSRDIPALGPRIPTETLRRLWTMIANTQGAPLNHSKLAASLNVSAPTVVRYVDLLVELLLVRRLQPFHVNTSKRLVKAPKVYIRDSGLLHALLSIPDRDTLFGHPVIGGSWEGHVIETLINCAPDWTTPFFYRTARGEEIDLILELPGGDVWAIEVKRGLSPKVEAGFHKACDDLQPQRRLVVYGGDEKLEMPHGIEACSLPHLASELIALKRK